MHAAYGTVTLYKSSWWPVDTRFSLCLITDVVSEGENGACKQDRSS